jgi:hypothetical protein
MLLIRDQVLSENSCLIIQTLKITVPMAVPMDAMSEMSAMSFPFTRRMQWLLRLKHPASQCRSISIIAHNIPSEAKNRISLLSSALNVRCRIGKRDKSATGGALSASALVAGCACRA